VGPAFHAALGRVNGAPENPGSFDLLDRVLADQAYRLAFWRVAADEINYRRFFDINELAAIRVEDPEVFAAVHAVTLDYVGRGLVTGLRIDHVDGLFDPEKYLCDLQHAFRLSRGQPGYVVVEKILGPGELLPPAWPVAGTTGYEALNLVSGVLTDRRAAAAFRALAAELHEGVEHFADVVYQSKRAILKSAMASELTVLARRLDRISEQHRYTRDFTRTGLREALAEVIASFPVYRTYVRPDDTEVSPRDASAVDAAIRGAKRRNPTTSHEIFDFIHALLRLEEPEGIDFAARGERRQFVLKLQQLTGPIMAKGVEDTAFYRFFPLAALNEVGGEPEHFGVEREAFHAEQVKRQRHGPASLSASATHDTKRGEDTRARLLVLSEIPSVWRRAVRRWSRQNAHLVVQSPAGPAPNPDEEYLLYQTLVGAWPIGGLAAEPGLTRRVEDYMEKALREAKLNTSWIEPNELHDEGVRRFVRAILDPEQSSEFLADFERLHRTVEWAGYWNGLAQTVLKVACPGVPDVYQGTELWDLSLVDPDNRRPVDFAARARLLRALTRQFERDPERTLARLTRRPADGRVKLWVLHRALSCRRDQRFTFESGSYVPLEVQGSRAEQVVAFARVADEGAVIALAGRFFTRFGPRPRRPFGEAWEDTCVVLPPELAGCRLRDALSGRELGAAEASLPLARAFEKLPVALVEVHRE
jgi:(1->4)-alpha-D-glucan 1-alpha-D-glucosylmutase